MPTPSSRQMWAFHQAHKALEEATRPQDVFTPDVVAGLAEHMAINAVHDLVSLPPGEANPQVVRELIERLLAYETTLRGRRHE